MPIVPLSSLQGTNTINPTTNLPEKNEFQKFEEFAGKGYVGDYNTGMGQTLTPEEAHTYTKRDINYSVFGDNEERRAELQPTWEKWTNATAKMGILAGTT